jgi:hypothetical protein
MIMARKPVKVDRDKFRAAVRKLGNEGIFSILDEAIDLLSQPQLHKIAKRHLDIKQLRPDTGKVTRPGLLTEVRRFEKASLDGQYYESFDVNSKNYMEESDGTCAWIADHLRLLDRCVTRANNTKPAEVCKAMDILFGLLDHIDEGNDDVIFFGDEGGSWQVGVDWSRVLPAWFKVLAATVEPEEYAGRIAALLSRHCHHDRDKMLAIARRTATIEQRKALARVKSA